MKRFPMFIEDEAGNKIHVSYSQSARDAAKAEVDAAFLVLLTKFKGRGDRPRPKNQADLDAEINWMIHEVCTEDFPDVDEEDLLFVYTRHEKETVAEMKKGGMIALCVVVVLVAVIFNFIIF